MLGRVYTFLKGDSNGYTLRYVSNLPQSFFCYQSRYCNGRDSAHDRVPAEAAGQRQAAGLWRASADAREVLEVPLRDRIHTISAGNPV